MFAFVIFFALFTGLTKLFQRGYAEDESQAAARAFAFIFFVVPTAFVVFIILLIVSLVVMGVGR